MAWLKFKWPFSGTDRCEKTRVDSLAKKLTVHEEYIEALRTKSYTEMLNKVQDQLRTRKSLDRSPSSSSLPFRVRLSDYLLQPRQETLSDVFKASNLHYLLIDYFEASFEACNSCELLLGSVHQARANYRIIQSVVGEHTNVKLDELASFTMLNNPMLIITPSQFHDLHDNHDLLLHRLTLKCRSVKRRLKFNRYSKKILGFSLLIAYGGLVIALLVIAIHSMVAIVAAPPLACSLGLAIKRFKLVRNGLKTRLLEKFGAQLEVASKGVFIQINDFDTMSRVVKRLQDEIEHIKAIADMCVRSGKSEVLMEVVREFRIHQTCFLEQLEELEEHIYLCFLTINRSRMLVMQDMAIQQHHRWKKP